MTLTIQNISKKFDDFYAVQDVSLTVKRGEIISILGPSGCGKSTLLQLIAGLQQPDNGEIWMDDNLISSPNFVLPPEKRPVNMVFQDYALWPHMNVQQNIAYGMKRQSRSRKEIQKSHSSLFQLLQLEGLETHYPAQLSGGQQQRVAIARALATEPDLLLLDEPLSNLDMQLRHEMRNQLSYLLRQLGTTVLHVTHDPLEAFALADRILVLRKGKIEQFDTPEQVYQYPASLWVAGLLGFTNRLEGTVTDHILDNQCTITIGNSSMTVTGIGQTPINRPVTIVIDSEDIEIVDRPGGYANDCNYLQGKVKFSIYEGKKFRVLVNIAGNEMNVLHTDPIPTDTDIWLKIQPKNMLIFEHNAETPVTHI